MTHMLRIEYSCDIIDDCVAATGDDNVKIIYRDLYTYKSELANDFNHNESFPFSG